VTRRCCRRAPSITVSDATETLGKRVKMPVNENDDDEDNDDHRSAVWSCTTEKTRIAESIAAANLVCISSDTFRIVRSIFWLS